ncbi:MAG: hypothetical protein KAY37_09840 [Phycisphaerae bacterium]|nr:hypothetical protein [Phycisphaerae bacterium]
MICNSKRVTTLIVGTMVCSFCTLCVQTTQAQDKQPKSPTTQPAKTGQPDAKSDQKLIPLELKLPKPTFKGTPTHVPPGTNLEKPRKGPRKPLMVPPGVKNVARGKPVTSSDDDPIIGHAKLVTDGDKEAREDGYVELGPMLQYVQIDLKQKYELYAMVVWHYHLSERVYHDVVVQVADDPDFIENVRTVFNNDHDNSSGLGLGKAKEYWDMHEGKLIDAKGVKARYVRLYSNGSTADDLNHYTEVEVYGLPVK